MDALGRHGCSQNEKKRCLFSEGASWGTSFHALINVSKTTCVHVFVYIRTIAASARARLWQHHWIFFLYKDVKTE